MTDPLRIASDALAPAFAAVAGHAVDPVVRPSDRADAQANGALALAKTLGRPPREVAEAVLGALDGTMDEVAALEVAGPGFLNITFLDEFLARQLAAVAADERLGILLATQPETVVIDYSHPNVAKEMHVGHLRTTIIGDALDPHARLRRSHRHPGEPHRRLGHAVRHADRAPRGPRRGRGRPRAVHGRPRRLLPRRPPGLRRRSGPAGAGAGAGGRCSRAAIPRPCGSGSVLVEQSTRYFDAVYDRLGVLLEPDDLMGESAYNDLLRRWCSAWTTPIC